MCDLFNSSLDFRERKDYNPHELKERRQENMNRNHMFDNVFELESTVQFPNLLADKDFVYYNWTLPFCEA